MNELLYMGGYAVYVWSAYGLAAAVLIGMIAHSVLWHRRLLKDLRRRSRHSGTGVAATGKAPPHDADTRVRLYGTGSGAPARGKGHRENGAP